MQLKQISFNERMLAIMDVRRPLGPSDVLKSVSNPASFQACRWLSESVVPSKTSLLGLRCVDAATQPAGNTLLSFSLPIGPFIDRKKEAKPLLRPLEQHNFSAHDVVTVSTDTGEVGRFEVHAVHEDKIVVSSVEKECESELLMRAVQACEKGADSKAKDTAFRIDKVCSLPLLCIHLL